MQVDIWITLMLLVIVINLAITVSVVRHVNALNKMYRKPYRLSIGDIAPLFDAVTLTGETTTMSDYAGQTILLFFINPFCAPCTDILPYIEGLGPVAKNTANVQFVLVSDESEVDTKLMAERLELKLPVLIAPRLRNPFTRLYNPDGAHPFFCMIDLEGKLALRGSVPGNEWTELKQQWVQLDRVRQRQNRPHMFN